MSLEIVNILLGNEKKKPKNKGKQKYKKIESKQYKFKTKTLIKYTDDDLEFSGWNLKFNKKYKETVKEGDIIKLTTEQQKSCGENELEAVKNPSLYAKACVRNTKIGAYGWGTNYKEAIENCIKSINAIKKHSKKK